MEMVEHILNTNNLIEFFKIPDDVLKSPKGLTVLKERKNEILLLISPDKGCKVPEATQAVQKLHQKTQELQEILRSKSYHKFDGSGGPYQPSYQPQPSQPRMAIVGPSSSSSNADDS